MGSKRKQAQAPPEQQPPAPARGPLWNRRTVLLGALAACAQLTCQMVAAAMGTPIETVEATVEGDLDLRGTLGLARDAQVGFESIRLPFDIAAPEATEDELAALRERTERYCVVLQTLLNPPRVDTIFGPAT